MARDPGFGTGLLECRRLLFGALLAGCSNLGLPTGSDAVTGVRPEPSGNPSQAGAEELCVDTINQYRGTLALPALARWTAAEMCADGQAESDSQTGTAHGAFGRCAEWAQNECPGWPGPAATMTTGCLQAMWNEGPGEDFEAHGH